MRSLSGRSQRDRIRGVASKLNILNEDISQHDARTGRAPKRGRKDKGQGQADLSENVMNLWKIKCDKVLWKRSQRSDPAIGFVSLQRISCSSWLLAVILGLPTGAIFLYCMMPYQFAPVSLTGSKQASEEPYDCDMRISVSSICSRCAITRIPRLQQQY